MSELSLGSLSGLAANSYVVDVAAGSTLDVTNATGTIPGAVLPAGSILQVVQATKTDTFSTTSTSYTDITGLSATITPSSTTSKIMILSVSRVANQSTIVFTNLVRGSTTLLIGDAAGSRDNEAQQAFRENTVNEVIDSSPAIFLDSPNTTSPTTYKVQMRVSGGTGYLNRSQVDSDSSGYARTASSLILMEVAG